MSTENAPQMRITISEVLSLLDQGKSRKEIAEHFGQTQTAMKRMVWSNPKLKAKKAKKQYEDLIVLEDDTVVADAPAPVAEVEAPIADIEAEDEPVAQGIDADAPDWN